MNGSNHLSESDARPVHLCPVDLRKLCWNVKADARSRYEDLATVYTELGFESDAQWLRERLDRIH